MKIKCIITDDEPLARKGLRGYVERVDFLELQAECRDAIQLNSLLKETTTDLLFLDIEMPHLSGLDFLAGLASPPRVILTTAYEKYALKGYEFHVTDYLLKPISFHRFLQSVNDVYALLEKERGRAAGEDEFLFVRTDKQLKKIRLSDILYIESMENYIQIHMPACKEVVNVSLKQMLASLPGDTFTQVHRSYIANLPKVEAIAGGELRIGGRWIPVGRNMRDEIIGRLTGGHVLPLKNEKGET